MSESQEDEKEENDEDEEQEEEEDSEIISSDNWKQLKIIYYNY